MDNVLHQDILAQTMDHFTMSEATPAPLPLQRTEIIQTREMRHAAIYAFLIANPGETGIKAELLQSRRFLLERRKIDSRHLRALQLKLDVLLKHREVMRREQSLRIGRPNASAAYIQELYHQTYGINLLAEQTRANEAFEASLDSESPPSRRDQLAFRRQREIDQHELYLVAHAELVRGGHLLDGDHGDQTREAIRSLDNNITLKHEAVIRAEAALTTNALDINKVEDELGTEINLSVDNLFPLVKLLSHYGRRFPDQDYEGITADTVREHLRFINRFARRSWTIPVENIMRGETNFTFDGFDPVIQNLEALCSAEAIVLNNLSEATAMAASVSPETSDIKFFPTVAASFATDGLGVSTLQPAPHVSGGLLFRSETEYTVIDRDVLFANALDNLSRSPGARRPLDGELEVLYLLNDVARCGLDPESWLGEHGVTIGGLVKRILRLWVENGHKALTADMLLTSFRTRMLYSQPSPHLQSVFQSQLEESRANNIRRQDEQDALEDERAEETEGYSLYD